MEKFRESTSNPSNPSQPVTGPAAAFQEILSRFWKGARGDQCTAPDAEFPKDREEEPA